MGFIARRGLQDRRLDFDKALAREPSPHGGLNSPPGEQKRSPVGVNVPVPPGGRLNHDAIPIAKAAKFAGDYLQDQYGPARLCSGRSARPATAWQALHRPLFEDQDP